MISILFFLFSNFFGFSYFYYDLDSFRSAGPYKADYYDHSITFNAKTVPDAWRTEFSDCSVVDFSNGAYTCYGRMENIRYYGVYDGDGVEIQSHIGNWDRRAYIYLTCSDQSNQLVIDRISISSYSIDVYLLSPWGCKGSGPGLPKATTAKCKKPLKIKTKYMGVKKTIMACKKGCFKTDSDGDYFYDDAASCMDCSYLNKTSECDSYTTCHYRNDKCHANSCPQFAKDMKKEADEDLADCLKSADEYENEDQEISDYKAECRFYHNHYGRLMPAEEHKIARVYCHHAYGCMYNQGKWRCSFFSVWAFIVTLVASITFVLAVVIIVIIFWYLRMKRGDCQPTNESDKRSDCEPTNESEEKSEDKSIQ